jgi:hypothetical protein
VLAADHYQHWIESKHTGNINVVARQRDMLQNFGPGIRRRFSSLPSRDQREREISGWIMEEARVCGKAQIDLAT